MRDVIAFLFGALTLFTGYYVWWSHRRFNRVKELLTDVIGRTQRLDMNMDRIGLTVSLFSGSIAELNRRVEFMMSTHPEAPPPGQDHLAQGYPEDEKPQKTAWDHLKERVDEL